MNKYKKWVLVLIWMSIIFFFSHQDGTQSSSLSNGLTEWIQTVILKGINIPEFGTYIRFFAHFFVFMVLGLLTLNAYEDTELRTITQTFIISFIYALTDEFHQSFIPGRASEWSDVMVDSFGIITGILILLLIRKRFNRRLSLL